MTPMPPISCAPAFRSPLSSPGAIRAALATGTTPEDVVVVAARQWTLAQPSAVRSAVTGKVTDLESSGWVKAQMAKRANYIRERVLPPLRAPGATVEGKKAARLLAAMDAEEAAEQRGKSSTMNVEA